jgi:CRISPR-associated protein Cmx8
MTAKARTKDKGQEQPVPNVLTLDYSLAELPSAQHRAGLAGLVLMVRWLDRLGGAKKGVCTIDRIDERGATFTIDLDGLRRLLDVTYAAAKEEVPKKALWKNKDKEIIQPIRTEERETKDPKGKVKKEKLYYYEVVIPQAGFLQAHEPTSPDGKAPWLKLWRDMIWETLRGVPATREPFDARAEGRPTKDHLAIWADLTAPANRSVEQPSTYYLGAQATTADNVAFRDRGRYQLLLHFWPYAAQIYVPRLISTVDGSSEFSGYVLTIPDVAALETFCEELPLVLKARTTDMAAYRPKGSVIDLPAEGALDLAQRLREQISTREGDRATSDVVLGFDIFHIRKEGNSVRTLSASRVEPAWTMVDAYVRLRKMELWDPTFRRARLVNLLDEKPWYTGFDRIVETLSQNKLTIGSSAFRHDARLSFELEKKQREDLMNEGEEQAKGAALEDVIYALMQSYVLQRLDSKYDLKWETAKDNPKKRDEYNEKKQKIAKDAFLAVRSRTGADFVSYFAGTLCSVSQYLPKERFALLTRALHDETERVRTLTLLALSAVG